jgi:hypothetical protein
MMPDRAVEGTLRRAGMSHQVGTVGPARGPIVTTSGRNVPGTDGPALEDPGAAAEPNRRPSRNGPFPGGGRRRRRILGPEPVRPSLQAPRRRHAGAVPDARNDRLLAVRKVMHAERPEIPLKQASRRALLTQQTVNGRKSLQRTGVAPGPGSSPGPPRVAPGPPRTDPRRPKSTVGFATVDGISVYNESGQQDLNPAWPSTCCPILLRSDRPKPPRSNRLRCRRTEARQL